MHKAFIYSKSLGENKCLMKLVLNANPHLSEKIPQRLIDWGMRNVIGVVVNRVRARCENLPDVYK